MKGSIKKVLSLLLAVAMLVSMISSVAFATGDSNGKTITLSYVATSDGDGEEVITSVANGGTFYLFVNFEGNPTELA
ncbi:MAG: hypothetical protein IKW60_05165, partial [Clostridia bacterium]|nr:hypothetical protein [Clostridia bacterium]